MNTLAEVLVVDDNNEVKPRKDWREHFAHLAEPKPVAVVLAERAAERSAEAEPEDFEFVLLSEMKLEKKTE